MPSTITPTNASFGVSNSVIKLRRLLGLFLLRQLVLHQEDSLAQTKMAVHHSCWKQWTKSVTEWQLSANTVCFRPVYEISVPHIIHHSIPLTGITGPEWKGLKGGKTQFQTQFSRKNQETDRNNCPKLTLLTFLSWCAHISKFFWQESDLHLMDCGSFFFSFASCCLFAY